MPQRIDPKPGNPVLIPPEQITAAVSAMAQEISHHYAGRDLLAVVVLRGGFIFAADLLRGLAPTIPVRLDFVRVSSYGDRTVSSGDIRIIKDLEVPPQGADVLIIDDILDTGRTLRHLRALSEARGARSVRVAVLLQKDRADPPECLADYTGFRIPDVFVVGYGLDHAGRHRTLPDIRILDPETLLRE